MSIQVESDLLFVVQLEQMLNLYHASFPEVTDMVGGGLFSLKTL